MPNEKIWVAGHNGMVGSSLHRLLKHQGRHVLTVDRADLDLRDQTAVNKWLEKEQPTSIIFAAAKVGGIFANDTYPADFIYDNIVIETNVIHGAHVNGIDRLIFLGSSCIYPKFANQPISESELLTGPLEPTNEWYAIAKIAGIKLCQAYRKQYGRHYVSVMPCNLYGPKDNFHPKNSHVVPALIRKFHEAKIANLPEVTIWGSGTPLREFLHVDDLANGVIFCHDNYDEYEHINCGAGDEVSIGNLARMISDVVGFGGELHFDTSKPDGTPRKLMDSSKIANLGWKPQISLSEGLRESYNWYLENVAGVESGR